MRVVVTGASGFIGHNVLLRAPREWEIVAVYHRTAGLEAFVAEHGLRHVRPIQCDLLDAGDVQALARTIGAARRDVRLAANGDPPVSAERPRWDLESNTLALITCLEHCPAGHVVYVRRARSTTVSSVRCRPARRCPRGCPIPSPSSRPSTT
jgi:nucleoside-diphosphate-sugar epimerase